MLPGVQQDFLMMLPQRAADRRGLDELGTSPNDGEDLQAAIPE
jgi:hypothetical protein